METAKVGSPVAKIVITLLFAAGAAGRHLAMRTEDSTYLFVDQLYVAGLRPNAGKELRVHGYVEPGSVMQHIGNVYRFTIGYRGMKLRVTATSPPPEAIRDQADVIVTGRLVEGEPWILEGSVVVAKCGGYRDAADQTTQFK